VNTRSVRNRATRVLITGFGPFPGAPSNPTQLLVARLAKRRRPALAAIEAIVHVFPTSYTAVDTQLKALAAQHQPDAIVMFGLAGRTKGLRIETLARNRTLRVFPDSDGATPKRGVISPDAEAMRGRAPFARLAAAARATGLPARLSRDAGRYVCNYSYWRALETATHPGGPSVVAFVHVPSLRKRKERGERSTSPTIDQLVRGAQAIVIAAAATATSYR
jgi:pyroglutamyl-peptidase